MADASRCIARSGSMPTASDTTDHDHARDIHRTTTPTLAHHRGHHRTPACFASTTDVDASRIVDVSARHQSSAPTIRDASSEPEVGSPR